jgi:chromate reductase
MIMMGQPEVYVHWKEGLLDEAGRVIDEAVLKRLTLFLDRYALWVERMTAKSA